MASGIIKNNSAPKFYAPPRMKDYVLTEKLGQGTYATVYKAFRKGNNREIVAVKCIKRTSLRKNSSDNLIREIEILKSLDHPHIVKLQDFQWDDEHIFLILEFCSGGDLSTLIKRFKILPEQVARKFFRQLALALKYIRERNISHMDLKPQNIFLESKENLFLKVGDFGFAQHILGKEERNNLRGSPLYMAVEMFCSESYDASVDLWSTGCILHETLFGYAPFASSTFEELEVKIQSTEPIQIPHKPAISCLCRDLLKKLLERNPKSRISFEDFFQHPFVDLSHAPSAESLPKAIAFVTRAVEFDTKKEYGNSLECYCAAIEHFLPAIDFEPDSEKKAAIRLKVKQYIARAEQLKSVSKQTTKGKLQRSMTIESLLQELPEFRTVILHEENGERFDDNRQYKEALAEYYKGIDLCMMILSKKGDLIHDYRSKIREKAEKLIKRSEELNRYCAIMRKESKDVDMCCIQ